MEPVATVSLHWLPLGAGGKVVRFCGRFWERIQARLEHRPAAPLFHSALEVVASGGNSVIEIAPALNSLPVEHGVVGTGSVGAAWAGRFRAFRYELRCWEGGEIPDLQYESGLPLRLSESKETAERLIGLTGAVPMLVWGRDELRLGEMWNSNSVIAWLLAAAGIDLDGIRPPEGGRAPGWSAGIEAFRRSPPSPTDRPETRPIGN